MSGFDENPFGDPFASQDPFKVFFSFDISIFFPQFVVNIHYLINNAYLRESSIQDPSIQQVAQNTANNNQNLDDYDPFSSSTKNSAPTLQTLPAYSASGQQYQINDSNNGSGNNLISSSGGGVTQISTAELQVSHQFPFFFCFLCAGICLLAKH